MRLLRPNLSTRHRRLALRHRQALGAKDRQEACFGAEVRAKFAEVGIGAGTLGQRPQAVAAPEAGLDERRATPVVPSCTGAASGSRGPRRDLAKASARS